MTFTSDICMPEILKLQKQGEDKESGDPEEQSYLSIQNDDDKEVMPLVCFYNALSFLKRLPTDEEISEPEKKIDLMDGYQMKDSFIELKNSDKGKCQSDLQNLYEEQIDGRMLDGLLPFQEKYVGNSYIDVYKYFCRSKPESANIKNVKQMYTIGLEL